MIAETVRSAQGDAAIVMLALGLLGLLFAGLAFVADVIDRRAWRRDVARAHSTPRPFDWQRDEEAA